MNGSTFDSPPPNPVKHALSVTFSAVSEALNSLQDYSNDLAAVTNILRHAAIHSLTETAELTARVPYDVNATFTFIEVTTDGDTRHYPRDNDTSFSYTPTTLYRAAQYVSAFDNGRYVTGEPSPASLLLALGGEITAEDADGVTFTFPCTRATTHGWESLHGTSLSPDEKRRRIVSEWTDMVTPPILDTLRSALMKPATLASSTFAI